MVWVEVHENEASRATEHEILRGNHREMDRHIANSGKKHRHAKRTRVIFLVIGSRSIRRTVHINDLVKFFGGLRCTARRKLEIYNL